MDDYQKVISQIVNYRPINRQEEIDKSMIMDYINLFEDILSRKNRVTHVVCMALVLNNNHNKVLMVHHNLFKRWSLPGGHADGCAELEYVAIKEVEEETGLKLERKEKSTICGLDILPVPGHIKNGAYISAHTHITITFKFYADEYELLQNNIDENSAVEWKKIDEFEEVTDVIHMKNIYMKLKAREIGNRL